MVKIRLGVIFGGESLEHEVSITSAKAVLSSLDKTKYHVFPIGIDKHGIWHFFEGEDFFSKLSNGQMPNFSDLSSYKLIHKERPEFISFLQSLDCVFPVLHGPNGEDGTIQGFLQLFSVPFVGSKALGSSICMDKDVCKRLLLQEGLLSANAFVLNKYRSDCRLLLDEKKKRGFLDSYDSKIFSLSEKIEKKCDEDHTNSVSMYSSDSIYQEKGYELNESMYDVMIETLHFPLFVKPANLGSSVGIEKVNCREGLIQAITNAFTHDTKVLVEECIVGREIECSVLGGKNPKTARPGEVIPSHDFYSYSAKYLDEKGASFQLPAKLESDVAKRIQSQALQVFIALECEGLARVDFFLANNGTLYVNEVNTIPGFTPISLYPKLLELSGITFQSLVENLIEIAMDGNKAVNLLSNLLIKTSKVIS